MNDYFKQSALAHQYTKELHEKILRVQEILKGIADIVILHDEIIFDFTSENKEEVLRVLEEHGLTLVIEP